ncbi:MAG: type II secretion system secretin GspD [Bdellovibrionales bacterium]
MQTRDQLLQYLLALSLVLSPSLGLSQDDDLDAPPPGTFESSDDGDSEGFKNRFDRFKRFKKSEDDDGDSRANDRSRDSSRSSFGRGGGVNERFSATKKRKRESRVEFANAEPEDITNENFPELIDSFDYPNADIADVIKAISELTGKNFIVENNVRGKITIIAPTQITVAEAYKAFLSSLAMAGFTVVPAGKFLKIRSSRAANRDSIQTYSGEYSPDTDQMITRIVHFKHVSAEEIQKKLRILTSKDGESSVYAPTNSLIITDYGSRIQTVYRILQQLDVPGFEEQLEAVPIKYAKAKDIASLIDQIINKGGKATKTRGSFSSGIRRFGNSKTPNSSGSSAFSTVIPDERTNSIIVVGNRPGINKIKDLVKKLDFRLNPEDAGGVYVYYMKYGEAKATADILNGIAKEQAKTEKENSNSRSSRSSRTSSLRGGDSSSDKSMFGGDVKITADETINALIVTANRQDFNSVKGLLAKIDIPRNQVNVEAVIMEISSTDSNTKGISTINFPDADNGLFRMGYNSGNITSLVDITSSGGIFAFGGGKDVTIEIGGAEQTVKSLTGLLTILKSVTSANVLSTPHITAMDNTKAIIEVGETVPVGIETVQNGVTTTSAPQREPVTIKLEITPRISPGSNAVAMEINQSIKQLSLRNVAAKALAESSISTSERTVQTFLTVDDGDTAVIGGLIREVENAQTSKVPLLGDLPVIGWFFKSNSVSKEKANLLMFITPKIIRNNQDSRSLVDKRLDDRIEFIKKNTRGVDKFGERALSLRNRSDGFQEIEPESLDDADELEPDLKNTTDDQSDFLDAEEEEDLDRPVSEDTEQL